MGRRPGSARRVIAQLDPHHRPAVPILFDFAANDAIAALHVKAQSTIIDREYRSIGRCANGPFGRGQERRARAATVMPLGDE